jgi:hypothetical protein
LFDDDDDDDDDDGGGDSRIMTWYLLYWIATIELLVTYVDAVEPQLGLGCSSYLSCSFKVLYIL